jgi:hypothetical protein
MSAAINRFYNALKDAGSLKATELVDYFAYFLTTEGNEEVVATTAIDDCFRICDLQALKNTSAYLSKNTSSKPPKYIKVVGGYRLERAYREQLGVKLGVAANVLQTSAVLQGLASRLPSGAERGFLKELVDCFEMCWILVLDHLYAYVLQHHLANFNGVLASNNDKRIRVTKIQDRDDFGDIPEGRFIEFMRSAGVISNDVRKILDEKLGIRNSSAHPSSVSIKPSKVVEFIDDLVENVILKYPI